MVLLVMQDCHEFLNFFGRVGLRRLCLHDIRGACRQFSALLGCGVNKHSVSLLPVKVFDPDRSARQLTLFFSLVWNMIDSGLRESVACHGWSRWELHGRS